MEQVACGCGCGTMIPAINKKGRPARFAHGHNPATRPFQKGHPSPMKGRPNPRSREVHAGKKLTPEQIAKRQQTRLANNEGVYQVKRGWKHKPGTIERMKAASLANARRGEANPFYGRQHSAETRARLSEANSGERNAAWRGGVAVLPYGPEFTKRYKRLIRDRDKHTCQRCGKTREQNGRTMQVHHKDHDKANNDPTNLVTVCNSCNVWLSYHRDEPFAAL